MADTNTPNATLAELSGLSISDNDWHEVYNSKTSPTDLVVLRHQGATDCYYRVNGGSPKPLMVGDCVNIDANAPDSVVVEVRRPTNSAATVTGILCYRVNA